MVKLSEEGLRLLAQRARAEHRTTLSVLVEEFASHHTDILRDVAGYLSYSFIEMHELRSYKPEFEILPFHECTQRLCLLAKNEIDGHRKFIVVDPFNSDLRAWAEENFSPVDLGLCDKEDLLAYLALQEETLKAVDEAQYISDDVLSNRDVVEALSLGSIAGDKSPAVRLVNSTIYDAITIGASDIHFETLADGLQVKYRIDGVLSLASKLRERLLTDQVVSRIKVMSELDIAEHRIPQDGRFKLLVKGRDTDFRVSVMPSVHGEDVVVRVLDKRGLTDHLHGLSLDKLGFDDSSLASIRRLASEPYGMLLVTGPTGSGKTTTLYAAISEINSGREKIITIEDPVEYQLSGILQIPVNEKKGLSFARGLRSILRHDPDKILVGEIRDSETAEIAVQSALTGHLVFTSVHANNVFDVLGRFQHMGIDPHNFVSALNGIVAQRLIRTICPSCSTCATYQESELVAVGLAVKDECIAQLKRGLGCGHCRGTGYRGRVAIAEILKIDDELRELIVSRVAVRLVKQAAIEKGTRFLRQAAIQLVREGKTTIEEANRVTLAA